MAKTPVQPTADPYAALNQGGLTSILTDDQIAADLEARVRSQDALRGLEHRGADRPLELPRNAPDAPAFVPDPAPHPQFDLPAPVQAPRSISEALPLLTGRTLPASPVREDADPLLVDLLAWAQRLVAGGLISPFAADAVNTGLTLIDRIKERVAPVVKAG